MLSIYKGESGNRTGSNGSVLEMYALYVSEE